MRENKGFFSFAFDSAHVKYGVWTWRQLLKIDENLLEKLKSQNMLRIARTKFTGSLVDFSVKQTSTTLWQTVSEGLRTYITSMAFQQQRRKIT